MAGDDTVKDPLTAADEASEFVVLNYAVQPVGRFEALCDPRLDVRERRAGLPLWAFATLLTYLAALLVIYVPLAVSCFWERGDKRQAEEAVSWLGEWQFWLIVGVLLATQALFLILPVRASWDYQLRPRKLVVPLAVASLLLALLFGGIIFSIAIVVLPDMGTISMCVSGAVFLLSWLIWWRIFRRYAEARPDRAITAMQRAMIRGSIAELLVAVSCHLWVRQRGDCSAPMVTFMAICAGLAVMLCAFGPSAFYLFVARARRMKPKARKG